MQDAKRATLVEGSVSRTLVRLTIPMIIGIVGMVAFNLIDTYFVGQLGTAQLAAMSFTFPVIMVITSVAFGIGIGGSAVISRAIGQGDRSTVRRLTTDLLALALLVVILFVLVGLLTLEPVFRLLGATPELMPYIKQYMTIWYLAMVFVVIPMVGNNAIRATGDTKTPSIVMLVAVGVNVVLDPLLIFGMGPFPQLGLAGAALATAISRGVTLIVALWVLYYRDRMVTLVWPGIRTVLSSWKRILTIGIPATATNMIVPLGIGVVTALVAEYGVSAVAAFGVASRIDMFALTVVMALATVIGPFVGQNWGAGRHDRVVLGVRYSDQFSMGWGLLMFVLLALVAKPLADLFTNNARVAEYLVLYLHIVPLSYGLQGILRLSNYALNVLDRPLYAMMLTALQMFVLYIPLAYLGSMMMGVTGIFGAAALAHMLAGLAAYFVLRRRLQSGQASTLPEARPTPA